MRLKILREENNLSQLDLAQKLNMSQQAISAYEKGNREPDINTIKKIADFFGVSTDYLLGKTDIRNPQQETKIEDIYMHLAKEAQDLQLDKNDIDFILDFYKKHKK